MNSLFNEVAMFTDLRYDGWQFGCVDSVDDLKEQAPMTSTTPRTNKDIS